MCSLTESDAFPKKLHQVTFADFLNFLIAKRDLTDSQRGLLKVHKVTVADFQNFPFLSVPWLPPSSSDGEDGIQYVYKKQHIYKKQYIQKTIYTYTKNSSNGEDGVQFFSSQSYPHIFSKRPLQILEVDPYRACT